ncbi:MAG: YlxR family protein [Anaerolineaceae bacterium]|nr:YlxR family protein [Anaerolineaceae bacterium]
MATHKKHMPQRTCAACREVQAKRTLVRIVRTADGIEVDHTGKKSGRGVYLHESRSCWELGLKGAVARSLKITLSDADRKILQDYLDQLPEG